MRFYQQHVFICTNQKAGDKKCCAKADAMAACQLAKKLIKSAGLAGPGGIRVSQSGCLGRCQQGPAIVIYPQGVWYTYHSLQDVEEIMTEYVLGGRAVPRLLMPAPQSPI